MALVMRVTACAVGVWLIVGIGGLARADRATELARTYNARAEKLFSLGMFREAAAEYQRAYVAKPIPDFLYNLGQCHKRLGAVEDLERAIFFFESYVNNAAPSPLRDEVELQIAKLRKEVTARRYRPVYKRWWFWTVIGVVVAGAAVGTAIALRPQDQDVVRGTIGDPSPLQLLLRGSR
jgi:hypothetical protein